MTSLYRHILKQAWQFTKTLLYLWPLGLFAALLGNGGEYQVLFKEFKIVSEQPEIVSLWRENLSTLIPNFDLSGIDWLVLIVGSLIALALFLALLWLIISSWAGLIKGAALARRNERSTFKKLLLEGNKKFWPILGLNVLAKVIVYGFLILILGPLMFATFSQGNTSLNLLIVAMSFLVFVPLVVIVSLVTKYAAAYVILNGQRLKESLKNAWRLFVANWLISLEMAFILFVINILVGLGYIFIALLIFSPFLTMAVLNALRSPQLFDTLMYISITLLIILSAIVGAWLATFQISSWTLLYLRLTEGGKAYSKIIRWTAALPRLFKKKKI